MEEVSEERVAIESEGNVSSQLPSFGALLKISWEWYRTNFGFISGTAGMIFVVSGVVYLNEFVHPIVAICISLGALIGSACIQMVLSMFVIDGNRSGIHLWNRLRTLFVSYVWIETLIILATLGGIIAFLLPVFILNFQFPQIKSFLVILFIPVVISSILFSFSTFALFAEEKRGLGALERSWCYISSSFWAVSSRFILLLIVFTVGLWAIHGVLDVLGISTVVEGIQTVVGKVIEALYTAFIAVPMSVMFLYTLYRALLTQQAYVDDESSRARRSKWIKVFIGLGIFGTVIFVVLMVYLLMTYRLLFAFAPIGLQLIPSGISVLKDGIIPFGL